jgi:hypothetical protein
MGFAHDLHTITISPPLYRTIANGAAVIHRKTVAGQGHISINSYTTMQCKPMLQRNAMADTKRLSKLEQEMIDLKQKMAAERKRIRDQERKEDQKRQTITGAICIQHAAINLTFKATLEKLLREHVVEGDRYLWPELFGSEDDAEETETANDNMQQAANDNIPQQDMQALHDAYQAVGEGRGFVRIHWIRETLDWSKERFNDALSHLQASYKIELHGGDPSKLTKEEIENSYRDNEGQQFLTMSWRDSEESIVGEKITP